ncbi:MAG: presenilin family intramembrane aspartyl protease [Candidatus Micrarchaeota archaeon]
MRFVSVLLLVVFSCALVLGLFVGWHLVANNQTVFFDDPEEATNALIILGLVLFSTCLLFLVLRIYKGASLFKVIEYVLYFTAVELFSSLFVPENTAVALGLAVLALRYLLPQLRILFLVFSSCVVGALLGSSLGLIPAVLVGLLLSFYDLYAVFWSKHMISLVEKLGDRKAAFAINLKQGKEEITLGTGDVVIPVMLCVVALKEFSLLIAFGCVLGGVLGLAGLIFLMERRKGYYPALPPIVAGCVMFSTLFYLASGVL